MTEICFKKCSFLTRHKTSVSQVLCIKLNIRIFVRLFFDNNIRKTIYENINSFFDLSNYIRVLIKNMTPNSNPELYSADC